MSKKDNKLYYSIGEIAKILNVNNSLIRFWEKEFEVLKPKKNTRGNRIFTKNDLENILLIHHLLILQKIFFDLSSYYSYEINLSYIILYSRTLK